MTLILQIKERLGEVVSGGFETQMQIFLPLQGVRNSLITCKQVCAIEVSSQSYVWHVLCTLCIPTLC